MPEFTQPSEIARETLRQLAMRRIQPTPDNYLTLYCEIAGTVVEETFPEKALKQIAQAIPRSTAEQMRFAKSLETVIAEKNWRALSSTLVDFVQKNAGEPLPWAVLIRDLLIQLEARSASITTAKKRESLEHVLRASPPPELLYQRLQNVIRNWALSPATGADLELVDEIAPLASPIESSASSTSAPPQSAATSSAMNGELQELIARLLDDAIGGMLTDSPDLAKEATKLSTTIRAAKTPREVTEVAAQLKKFSYRLHFVIEDQAELKGALHSLLQLIVENIGELVIDDQWLHGQITIVSEIFNKPLDLRTLDDAERRLKDVIYKQGALKQSLNEANDRLKSMLATFVDRLGDFTSTTSGFHDKIEVCATKISKAKDISELSTVLEEVMRETRIVQLNAARSRDELGDMRRRVHEAEQEVTRLQTELSQASEMVRLDPLTGALNRKGMDEALAREIARTRRHDSMLSVALLDIDNFKKLNDTLGHQAGDSALIHLSTVTRETIRPQDTLARYGGEEFVIILPDTTLDDAILAMSRVQRELTRKFFMHDNNKVLITFSCGVAELAAHEEAESAIKRADDAMYLAKRNGKNRVMAG